AVRSILSRKPPKPDAAAAFHRGLAAAVADTCAVLRDKTGINHAALSGGVWQNAILLELTHGELRKRGFAVLTHRAIPPNDEGVSAGQAVVAAHRFRVRQKIKEEIREETS
ncbi:MAG: hypothetical protein FWG71_05665, partial [Synergistaceae bacterium]|nr:hypothetical protein [Synergistaceae bacterium]